MDYAEELKIATYAAKEAGRIMEQYRADGFDVDRKGDRADLITDADTACQDTIIDIISQAFPDDGFLAEENGQEPEEDAERTWVIDPIDGTTNYVHDFPFYCTSIALTVDGESVVGVVYAPRLDEIFSAAQGEGAWLNAEPISVSTVSALEDALVQGRIMSEGFFENQVQDKETRFLHTLLEKQASFRRPGAAALDLCQIACGRFDGLAWMSINTWDIAAGRLIVEEAGGTVREQESVVDGYREMVASNSHLQARLEEIFDEIVRN